MTVCTLNAGTQVQQLEAQHRDHLLAHQAEACEMSARGDTELLAHGAVPRCRQTEQSNRD